MTKTASRASRRLPSRVDLRSFGSAQSVERAAHTPGRSRRVRGRIWLRKERKCVGPAKNLL